MDETERLLSSPANAQRLRSAVEQLNADPFALWRAWLPYNAKPWTPCPQYPDEHFGRFPK